MSDMKCPVCNKGTVKEFETAPYFVCSNEFCPSYSETDTTEYDILIRTRKALDVAVDALKDMNEIIKNYEYGNGLYYALDGHDTMLIAEDVEKALYQITALEQKDK